MMCIAQPTPRPTAPKVKVSAARPWPDARLTTPCTPPRQRHQPLFPRDKTWAGRIQQQQNRDELCCCIPLLFLLLLLAEVNSSERRCKYLSRKVPERPATHSSARKNCCGN